MSILKNVEHVILIGGGQIFASVSKWLQENAIASTLIISPRHARERLWECDNAPTLTEYLDQEGLTYHLVSDWKEAFNQADMLHGMAVSLGSPWLFTKADIEKFFLNKLFNVHGTRLPTYRGGGGFSWQILNGNRYGFSLLHKVSPGIDAGDIVAYNEFLYPASCRTPRDYQLIYDKKSFYFLTDILKQAIQSEWHYATLSQPEYLSQYWPRLNTETHAWINWNLSVEQVDRFICAFDDPYLGAQTLYRGDTVRLKSCLVDYHDGQFHPMQSGLVYRTHDKWLCVAANGGTLIVQEVLDKDGRSCLGKIKIGERLYTPSHYLDAYHKTVKYNAEKMLT